LIDEHNTSSYCPICGIRGSRMYRGLFYCKKCGKKMNADVVALNIARKCGVKIHSNIKLHPKSIKIRETIIQKKIIPMRDNRVQTHPSNLHIGLTYIQIGKIIKWPPLKVYIGIRNNDKLMEENYLMSRLSL